VKLYLSVGMLLALITPQILSGLWGSYEEPYYNIETPISQTIFVSSSSTAASIDRQNWLLDIRHPVDDYTNTTSGWGQRTVYGCQRCSNFHKGLDYTPGRGAPVYAIMDGVIIQIENSGEYGVHVILEHRVHEDLTYTTVYAHLQVSNVTNRLQLYNNINKGDLLGLVGSTGLSTGAHLHFEVRKNGRHIDPAAFFAKNLPNS
jgi:murein DD-endopeptidase MepM/ murein hydrolase activator NlpD